jgi:hypothetical protein
MHSHESTNFRKLVEFLRQNKCWRMFVSWHLIRRWSRVEGWTPPPPAHRCNFHVYSDAIRIQLVLTLYRKAWKIRFISICQFSWSWIFLTSFCCQHTWLLVHSKHTQVRLNLSLSFFTSYLHSSKSSNCWTNLSNCPSKFCLSFSVSAWPRDVILVFIIE